jgi:hypothetical protein
MFQKNVLAQQRHTTALKSRISVLANAVEYRQLMVLLCVAR